MAAPQDEHCHYLRRQPLVLSLTEVIDKDKLDSSCSRGQEPHGDFIDNANAQDTDDDLPPPPARQRRRRRSPKPGASYRYPKRKCFCQAERDESQVKKAGFPSVAPHGGNGNGLTGDGKKGERGGGKDSTGKRKETCYLPVADFPGQVPEAESARSQASHVPRTQSSSVPVTSNTVNSTHQEADMRACLFNQPDLGQGLTLNEQDGPDLRALRASHLKDVSLDDARGLPKVTPIDSSGGGSSSSDSHEEMSAALNGRIEVTDSSHSVTVPKVRDTYARATDVIDSDDCRDSNVNTNARLRKKKIGRKRIIHPPVRKSPRIAGNSQVELQQVKAMSSVSGRHLMFVIPQPVFGLSAKGWIEKHKHLKQLENELGGSSNNSRPAPTVRRRDNWTNPRSPSLNPRRRYHGRAFATQSSCSSTPLSVEIAPVSPKKRMREKTAKRSNSSSVGSSPVISTHLSRIKSRENTPTSLGFSSRNFGKGKDMCKTKEPLPGPSWAPDEFGMPVKEHSTSSVQSTPRAKQVKHKYSTYLHTARNKDSGSQGLPSSTMPPSGRWKNKTLTNHTPCPKGSLGDKKQKQSLPMEEQERSEASGDKTKTDRTSRRAARRSQSNNSNNSSSNQERRARSKEKKMRGWMPVGNNEKRSRDQHENSRKNSGRKTSKDRYVQSCEDLTQEKSNNRRSSSSEISGDREHVSRDTRRKPRSGEEEGTPEDRRRHRRSSRGPKESKSRDMEKEDEEEGGWCEVM